MKQAKLQRLDASMSDLVAFGEVSYSGRVPSSGTAAVEIVTLLTELRMLGWIPASLRNVVGT